MSPDDIGIGFVVDSNRTIDGEDRVLTYNDSSGDPAKTFAIGARMGLSQVAEVDGNVVGFILGRIMTHPYFLEDSGVVTTIGIVPSFQRKCVATLYQSLGFRQDEIVELSART